MGSNESQQGDHIRPRCKASRSDTRGHLVDRLGLHIAPWLKIPLRPFSVFAQAAAL